MNTISLRARHVITHPLFSGSLVMVIGSNLLNVINYAYHVIMGRVLGPSAYGELAALFSLVGLLGVVAVALNLVVVKYISSTEDTQERVKLVKWFDSKTLKVALIFFAITTLSSPFIAGFLNITNTISIIMVSLAVVFMLLATVNRSVLQGMLLFPQSMLTFLIEHGAKLLIGVALVLLGFSVGGAIFAFVLATLFGWLAARKLLPFKVNKGEAAKLELKPVLLYSMPVLLQSIAVTSLYSTDLVLVKHFFTSGEAGLYAALSNLGKIIFFAAGPISAVMFPIVSKRHSQGKDYLKLFLYSLGATVLVAIGILLIFQLVPEKAIVALYGRSYLDAAGLLIYFGIFMTLFTLSSLLINFHLSLKHVKVVIFPFSAAILQAAGIWSFHDNLFSVIIVSIVTNVLLLTGLLIYTAVNSYLNQEK